MPDDLYTSVIGGFGGSVVRLLLFPYKSWVEAATSTLAGVLLAVYLTPVLYPMNDYYLETILGKGEMNNGKVEVATACVIGMVARDAIEKMIDVIRKYKAR